MKKTLKVAVGIIFSIVLFFLFIKDVNKVRLEKISGAGHGGRYAEDRTLFVRDAGNFQVGDTIRVRPAEDEAFIQRQVTEVHDGHQETVHYLIVDEAFNEVLDPEKGAYIQFPRLQRALSQANYLWLVPSLFLTFFALWVRAFRWKFFFPNYRGLSVNSLWVSVIIGYMANNVLPFRMGEIIRAWIFSRKEQRSISQTFGTIVMERVFDILSILIIFVMFVFYFSTKDDVTLPIWLIRGAWVLAAVSIVALLFLLALRFFTPATLKFVRIFLKPLPEKLSRRLLQLIESFVQGLSIFSSLFATFVAFFLSMVIWLVLAFAYLFVFKAVNIEASLLISVFLIVGLAFAVSIPSAPGFIGTFHFVGKEVLLMVGIHANVEAYVLLAHAMAYLPVLVLGFIYLSLENLTLTDLKRSIKPFENIKPHQTDITPSNGTGYDREVSGNAIE